MSDWNDDPEDDRDEWGSWDDDSEDDRDEWGTQDDRPGDETDEWGFSDDTSATDTATGGGGDGPPPTEDPAGGDDEESRSLLRATAVSLGLVIGAFAIGIITAVIAIGVLQLGLGMNPLENLLLLTVISTVTLQGIGMLGISIWYLYSQGYGLEYVRLRLPTLRDIGLTIGGIVITFVVLIAVQTILMGLGLESADHEIVEIATESPEVLLLMIPFSFLLVGPGEELLFRGIIQTKFVERSNVWAGILLASVFFAVVHIPAYGGLSVDTLPTIVALFFISLVLGGLYEYTDNLFVPIVIHGAFNAVQFGVLYLALTSEELQSEVAMAVLTMLV